MYEYVTLVKVCECAWFRVGYQFTLTKYLRELGSKIDKYVSWCRIIRSYHDWLVRAHWQQLNFPWEVKKGFPSKVRLPKYTAFSSIFKAEIRTVYRYFNIKWLTTAIESANDDTNSRPSWNAWMLCKRRGVWEKFLRYCFHFLGSSFFEGLERHQ